MPACGANVPPQAPSFAVSRDGSWGLRPERPSCVKPTITVGAHQATKMFVSARISRRRWWLRPHDFSPAMAHGVAVQGGVDAHSLHVARVRNNDLRGAAQGGPSPRGPMNHVDVCSVGGISVSTEG
jgi:hypothetical protein